METTDIVLFYRPGKNEEARAIQASISSVETAFGRRIVTSIRVVFTPFYDTRKDNKLAPASGNSEIVATRNLSDKEKEDAIKAGVVASGLTVRQTDLHRCGTYVFQVKQLEAPLNYGSDNIRNWLAFHVVRIYISDLPMTVFAKNNTAVKLWPPVLPTSHLARTRWIFKRKIGHTAPDAALKGLNDQVRRFCVELENKARARTTPLITSMSPEKGMTLSLALCGAHPDSGGNVVKGLWSWPYKSWNAVKLQLISAGVSDSDYVSLYMEYAHRYPPGGVRAVAEVRLSHVDWDAYPEYGNAEALEVGSMDESRVGVYAFQVNTVEDAGFERWSTVYAAQVAEVIAPGTINTSTGSEVVMSPNHEEDFASRYRSEVLWLRLEHSDGMQNSDALDVAKLLASAFPPGIVPCDDEPVPHFSVMDTPLMYGRAVKWLPATNADNGLYFCLCCSVLGASDTVWSLGLFDSGAETMSSSFEETRPFVNFGVLAALSILAALPMASADQLQTQLRALFDRTESTRRVFKSVIPHIADAVYDAFSGQDGQAAKDDLTVITGLGLEETKKQQADLDYYPPGLTFGMDAMDTNTVEVVMRAVEQPASQLIIKTKTGGVGVLWRVLRKMAREAPKTYSEHEMDVMRLLWQYANIATVGPLERLSRAVYNSSFVGRPNTHSIPHAPHPFTRDADPFLGLPPVDVCNTSYLSVDKRVKSVVVQSSATAKLDAQPYAYEEKEPEYVWSLPRYPLYTFQSPLYYAYLFNSVEYAAPNVSELMLPGIGFRDLVWQSPAYIQAPIRTAEESGPYVCRIDFGGNPMEPYDVAFEVIYMRDGLEIQQNVMQLFDEVTAFPRRHVAVEHFLAMMVRELELPPQERLRPGTVAGYAIALSPTLDSTYTRYNINAALAGVLAEYFGFQGDETQVEVMRQHFIEMLRLSPDFKNKSDVMRIVGNDDLFPYFMLSFVTKLDVSMSYEDQDLLQALYEALVLTARSRLKLLYAAVTPSTTMLSGIRDTVVNPEVSRVLYELHGYSKITEGTPYIDVDFEDVAREFVDGEFLTEKQLNTLKRTVSLSRLLDKLESKSDQSPRQREALFIMRSHLSDLPDIMSQSTQLIDDNYVETASLATLKRAVSTIRVPLEPWNSQLKNFFIVRVPWPPIAPDTRGVNARILSVVDVPATIITGNKLKVLESVRSMDPGEEVDAWKSKISSLDMELVSSGSADPAALDQLLYLKHAVDEFILNPVVPNDIKFRTLKDDVDEGLRSDLLKMPTDDLISARMKAGITSSLPVGTTPMTQNSLRNILKNRPSDANSKNPQLAPLFDAQLDPLYSGKLDERLSQLRDKNAADPIKTLPDFVKFVEPLQVAAKGVDDPDLRQLLTDANSSAVAKAVDAALSDHTDIKPEDIDAVKPFLTSDVLASLLARAKEKGEMQPATEEKVEEESEKLDQAVPPVPGIPEATRSDPYARLFLPDSRSPLVSAAIGATGKAVDTLPVFARLGTLESAYAKAFGISPPTDDPIALEAFEQLFSAAVDAQFSGMLADDLVNAMFIAPGMPLASARALRSAGVTDPRLSSVIDKISNLKCSDCVIDSPDALLGALERTGNAKYDADSFVRGVLRDADDTDTRVSSYIETQKIGVPLYNLLFDVYARAYVVGLASDTTASELATLAAAVATKVLENESNLDSEIARANTLFSKDVPNLMLNVYRKSLPENERKFQAATEAVTPKQGQPRRSILPQFAAPFAVSNQYKDTPLTVQSLSEKRTDAYTPRTMLAAIDAHLDKKRRVVELVTPATQTSAQAVIGAEIVGSGTTQMSVAIEQAVVKLFDVQCAVAFPIHAIMGTKEWSAMTSVCVPNQKKQCFDIYDIADVTGLSVWQRTRFKDTPNFLERGVRVLKSVGGSQDDMPDRSLLSTMLTTFRRHLIAGEAIQNVPLVLYLMQGVRLAALGGGDAGNTKKRQKWPVYSYKLLFPDFDAAAFGEWATKQHARLLLYNTASIQPYKWETLSSLGGGKWAHWINGRVSVISEEEAQSVVASGADTDSVDVFVDVDGQRIDVNAMPELAKLFESQDEQQRKALEKSRTQMVALFRTWKGKPAALYEALRFHQPRFLSNPMLDDKNPLLVPYGSAGLEGAPDETTLIAARVAWELTQSINIIEELSSRPELEKKLDSSVLLDYPIDERVRMFLAFIEKS